MNPYLFFFFLFLIAASVMWAPTAVVGLSAMLLLSILDTLRLILKKLK